jgi:heme exporter protein A
MRLSAVDLACHRGGRDVFAGLSFAVAAGEVLAVTGRNGAGKSSLLRTIVGLVRIAHGRLGLEGGDAELTIAEQAHYLGHQDALKPSLSVAENLRFWTAFLGSAVDIHPSLDAVGLDDLADLPAAYLSAGQRRRLSIARLIAVKRPIWLLDEPTSTLDAAAQDRLTGLMRAHLAGGGLIVAATHGGIGLEATQELRLGQPDASGAASPASSLAREGWGGQERASTTASRLATPTPDPSPQGGGEEP